MAQSPSSMRRLGVLLVHGIGDQGRGATLAHFGEPLFSYLRHWLHARGGWARLELVALREDPVDERAPAHAEFRLGIPGRHRHTLQPTPPESIPAGPTGSDGPRDVDSEEAPDPKSPSSIETGWILAESNWAEAFERPRFMAVAKWSLMVIPWLFLTQFADRLSYALERRRLGSAVISLLLLVFTFPLGLAIQVLVFLLVPMALIPPLRPLVAPIQRWISSVLGDTFVLLTSDFQFHSMVSKVAADINWLAEHCDAVAVLAHSQGAAVAHEAVRKANQSRSATAQGEPATEETDDSEQGAPRKRKAEIELLVTFGSAVPHLMALRRVTRRGAKSMLVASSLVTVSILVVAGIYLWNLPASGWTLKGALLSGWSLGVLLALVAYLMPFSLRRVNEKPGSDRRFDLCGATEWHDFYATADPVSNGPTPYLDPKRSQVVHNRANYLTDHSHYWDNDEEFCPGVVRLLLDRTGGEFADELPNPGKERRKRHRYRVAARAIGLLGAGHAAFIHPLIGSKVELPGALRPLVTGTAIVVNWLVSLLGDALSLVAITLNLRDSPLVLPRVPASLEALPWPVACLILVFLWFGASAWILRSWNRRSAASLLVGKPGADGPKPTAGWSPRTYWWLLTGALTLAIGTFWVAWGLESGFVTTIKELLNRVGVLKKPLEGSWYFPALFALQILYSIVYQLFQSSRRRLQQWRARDGEGTTKPLEADNVFSRGFWASRLSWFAGRDFDPGWAAIISVGAALALPGLFLFGYELGRVQSAAIALVALAFGIRAFVDADDGVWRPAAAARKPTTRPQVRRLGATGILVGVLVLPLDLARESGWSSAAGAGLLAVGLLAAATGLLGADLLRKGWLEASAAR